MSDILTCLGDVLDQSRKLQELIQNFACLWPQVIFERASELWDLHYKVHPDNDHVAKFHGDQSREFENLVTK